jgi:hypothetical protein
MNDERRFGHREQCYAKIRSEEAGLLGYVQDISDLGCRIIGISKSSLELGLQYNFSIWFEENAETTLSSCSFRGEIRWFESTAGFFLYGARVISFPSEEDARSFGSLLRYYGS